MEVTVFRSDRVESVHDVAVVAVRADGEVVLSHGDVERKTYMRSAAKPFQIIPFIREGAAEAYSVTEKELAVSCASHSGGDEHIATVRGLLQKCGIPESALGCGAHPPLGIEEGKRFAALGLKPEVIHNNCSGKHTAMLATAKFKGEPLEGYLEQDHPVQQRIKEVVMDAAEESDVYRGIDGCSAPVFYLPLRKMALMFAKLAASEGTGNELSRVRDAMTSFPEMVGGEGRFDTVMMRASGGRICTKMGAEGVQCLSMRSESGPVGIAIKVYDGNNRAVHPVAIKILEELGETPEGEGIEQLRRPVLKNHMGIHVGYLEVSG